ncbi:MAG TPA: IS21 family transposase [Anaerolineae bacterium]|nr:IS21 family transposase [Anaerolineae bacterium]
MIKDQYRRGVTISDLARETGHDRKTIRSVVRGPTVPPRKRKPRAKKLDPFVQYLEMRMQEGVLNCNKLLEEIRKRGYRGGKSLVKTFVHPHREARRQEATVRFETEPGEQAQVDWAHFGYIEHRGRRRKLYAFVMTLGWSRASYLEFTVSVNAAWWLRCHVHAFRYFGGVPRVVLHDNVKAAVLDREADGRIVWNERYLDFADYYGFIPRACRPYRAETKGKVEAGVRYVRSSFWPGLRFVDLADLNRQAMEWLDTVANPRVHGTTGAVPFQRLSLEGLQSIDGKPDYDTDLIVFRRSTKDCLVSYDGNYYSVPADYARRSLQVRETEDGQLVLIDTQDGEIARHRVAEGRNLRVAVTAHYAHLRPGSRPARRRGAIQVPAPQSLADLPAAPEVETRPLAWYDKILEVGS